MQDSGYKLRSRKNCPKSTPEQKQRQKMRLRKLRDLSRRCTFVMDDESYFDLDGNSFFGGNRFASHDLENVPPNIESREQKKFGEKLLIWIAISKIGHSEPYFHVTKGAINQKVYKEECLKRLYPFIKSHVNEKTLF